ncbi:hypothetical protein GGI23_002891 [Coemansia sp. RSA 2559]|nr:hypothetical protein GGI23_002891 [Coemansia sp. RSA 2559]KAJ2867334.1 hypothetical protein GGI22_001087 [Coemansia erecta]
MHSSTFSSAHSQADETKGRAGSLFSRVPRAQWTMELDYCFVHTLAQYTECNSIDGLVLRNKYVDPAIIRYVEAALQSGADLRDLAMDLSVRYPNKKKEHRSLEALQLLVELKHTTPSYTHQQLNHKHINMWTRSIVPFRHLHETGALFKGKTIFHKDCKRFVKAIMEVLSFAVYRGAAATLSSIFGKKPGQGSKLLEQWLNAMFDIHTNNMLDFMFGCAAKLARTFIATKPAEKHTNDDLAVLNDARPSGKLLLRALKEYLAKITECESLDSMAMPFPGSNSTAMPFPGSNSMAMPFPGSMGPGAAMEAAEAAQGVAMDLYSNRPGMPYPAPPAGMASGAPGTASRGAYSPVASASQAPPAMAPAFSSASNSGRGTPEHHNPPIRSFHSNAAATISNYAPRLPPAGAQSMRPAEPAPLPQRHGMFPRLHSPPPSSYSHREQRPASPHAWQRLPPPSTLHKPRPCQAGSALPPIAATGSGRRPSYSRLSEPQLQQPHQRQAQQQSQRYKPYAHHAASDGAHVYREPHRPMQYQPAHPKLPSRPPMAQYQPQQPAYAPVPRHPARSEAASPGFLSRPSSNRDGSSSSLAAASAGTAEQRSPQGGSERRQRPAVSAPLTIDSVFK